MGSSSVVVLRTAFAILGLVQFSVVIYTLVTDGSPFRKELLVPWMNALLTDFYILMITFIAWVWYKESSWIVRLVWVVLLISTGSVAATWYVAIEFLKLSPEDPPHLILLKDTRSRKGG